MYMRIFYFFTAIIVICCSLWLEHVSAHVIIPPQFKNYINAHPHAKVEDVKKLIDDWWSPSDIEWLSWMSSSELAARLLIAYWSWNANLILKYSTNIQPNQKEMPIMQVFWYFIVIGVKHILSWWDHILYILSLFLVIVSRKNIIWWLSIFTVAHSCALVLVFMWYYSFSSKITEIIIALSLIWTSAWYLWKWPLTVNHIRKGFSMIFIFWLFHGLWFANIFAALNLNTEELLISLIWFNVGVEIGQLFIVIILSIFFSQLKSHLHVLYIIQKILARVICILGIIWLIQRSFW